MGYLSLLLLSFIIVFLPQNLYSSSDNANFKISQFFPPMGDDEREKFIKSHVHSHTSDKVEYIDTHSHLLGKDGIFGPAAKSTLPKLNDLGIKTLMIMPPPQIIGQKGAYTAEKLVSIRKKMKGRVEFLGGGGSLNPLIYEAAKNDNLSDELIEKFKKNARELVKMGAKGFGELSPLHLSLNPHHPYIEYPPNHPLLLTLSDIAAKSGKMPIDLHMELVVKPFELSGRYLSATGTPKFTAKHQRI